MTGTAQKISLNFRRVTGAQASEMAEGTLVTGGFDLPRLKQQQKEQEIAAEARQMTLRRMKAEHDEAERKHKEEKRLRDLEEEDARMRARQERAMQEEQARRRAHDSWRNGAQDFNSSKPAYGAGSTNSGW